MITEKYRLLMYVVRQSPTKAPYYYTNVEGGDWIRWPEDKHFYYLPWLNLKIPIGRRGHDTVNMGGLKVHSLAFGETAVGLRGFQRWDCFNGFDKLIIDPVW